MSLDRCFLLWRNGERVVATVCDTPYGEPEEVWFEDQRCQPMESVSFFNHMIRPTADFETDSWQIVGFTLCAFPENDADRRAMDDLIQAKNVKGDAGWLNILLGIEGPFEDDAVQGFWLTGVVSPLGRTIMIIPEWDDSLKLGFEIVTEGAPTVRTKPGSS